MAHRLSGTIQSAVIPMKPSFLRFNNNHLLTHNNNILKVPSSTRRQSNLTWTMICKSLVNLWVQAAPSVKQNQIGWVPDKNTRKVLPLPQTLKILNKWDFRQCPCSHKLVKFSHRVLTQSRLREKFLLGNQRALILRPKFTNTLKEVRCKQTHHLWRIQSHTSYCPNTEMIGGDVNKSKQFCCIC